MTGSQWVYGLITGIGAILLTGFSMLNNKKRLDEIERTKITRTDLDREIKRLEKENESLKAALDKRVHESQCADCKKLNLMAHTSMTDSNTREHSHIIDTFQKDIETLNKSVSDIGGEVSELNSCVTKGFADLATAIQESK